MSVCNGMQCLPCREGPQQEVARVVGDPIAERGEAGDASSP
jgi:hypothetical protein